MSSPQVTLYTAAAPNGWPISIFLEELGISYEAIKMSISDSDIGKVHNQVKSPWYLEINPNGRIAAITHNGFNVFETSAILAYLQAEFDKENKFGFSPVGNPKEYSEVLQWLCFAHGGIGPMQGQLGHFKMYAPEQIPYAQNRYLNEVKRLYAVLDSRLAKHSYLAGDKYTIADIKAYGWVRLGVLFAERYGLDPNDWPHVKEWIDRIESRPAVQKGVKVP
ncbi:hypothetical protein E1B28_010599 [Marasmius oreades]|uniref:Glutathione S-transferase n=1 Tax=Marasmius oreades TaxID=181124 RepID=A0A9P7URA9_9AGAR|nr:uncharacterized protein E1B28_010599 [Marasmius oreades]KAG7091577.1 hypothetical protein E1B28_010599 [Marasmius oreades]